MDLTRQPPRRPSNPAIGGIVGLARMTDKARAWVDETLGEFVYGEDSGLDMIILEFLGLSAEGFADAATSHDDDTLTDWVRKSSDVTDEEIQEFNALHLSREPDEAGLERLRQRLETYGPLDYEVKTVFESIALDDWGGFREVDLISRAPRSPYDRSAMGVYGLARMAEKARAEMCGKLNDYIYNCPIDQAVAAFLGIDADAVKRAAWENPNDIEFSEWARGETPVTQPEIAQFNATLSSRGPVGDDQQEAFDKGLARVAPGRTDITTWFDLLDLDDEKSYDTVDLSRHAPRSPYDASAGGVLCLARMIDKARAAATGTLGVYYYGEDSGADRFVLDFLGVTADEFLDAVRGHPTDEVLVAWLNAKRAKSEDDIATFNTHMGALGPKDDAGRARVARMVSHIDPGRDDIVTFPAMMLLEDSVHFARQKAGV